MIHLFNFYATKCYKILIISPGLTFVQMAFLLGLFLEEPILGGAYYWIQGILHFKMGWA